MTVPFVSFRAQHEAIRDQAAQVFGRFFDSGYYVLGPMTKQFEVDYARFNEVTYAVGISYGLDALHLALKIRNIGPGDEVLVPSNTYIATALAVEMAGATVKFVEPDPHTYNISPANIRNAISPQTKAIMPVHLYGQACEMTEIMGIASEHNLEVIEDNAQAHGSRFDGVLTGAFGQANASSFYPTKNLGALGEAGAITTNSAEVAELARIWRNYGSEKRYYNQVKGFNNRIDELQAGLLSLKLRYLPKWTEERQVAAKRYLKNLEGISGLTLPFCHPSATHVYHLFVVRTDRRDALQEFLATKGITTVIHYPIPPHLQQAYAKSGYRKGDFPVAEILAETSLSLPLFPGITDAEIDYVSEQVSAFFGP
jgi:dTDP-4-amino-4,6-dideoxygalactose transaminase